jgi:hypothetical protein
MVGYRWQFVAPRQPDLIPKFVEQRVRGFIIPRGVENNCIGTEGDHMVFT